MIELLEILIISVLQGIGEFLPISSSGHNAVMNHLFERFGQPLTEGDADFIKLNVLLHFGTLIAVLVVFRKRIFDLFSKDWHLIPMLIIATIPAVLVGLPIKKFAPWIETDLHIISICFIGTGILLLSSLRRPEGEKTCSTMSFLDGLIIGCSQAVAIFPGLSRSGTTIVTGLFCKLKREEAATFSFLLSIPVIAGSGVLELKDLFDGQPANTSSNGISNWLLLLGMAVSCGVGILALTWLLDWLKKGKLWYFALWVFLMVPVTLTLAILPTPEKQVQTDPIQTATTINHQP